MAASDRRMILGVGLVVLAVYLPTLLSGRSLVEDPGVNDVSANFMTNNHWVGQAYRQGEFPLWNPHILCGMPHLGYAHCGGLYPPGILFFSLLPHVWAGSLTIIFHSLLCAILFYILMRQYDLGPALAAAAGLVFVFSGAFFGTINFFFDLGVVAGLLWMWICLRRAFQTPSLLTLLAAALGLAVSALGSDPELLAYSLIGLYPLLILEADRGWRDRLGRVLLISFVAALGLAITAALVLPVMETDNFSVRGPRFPFHLNFPLMGKALWLYLPTWVIPFRSFYQIFPSKALNLGLSPLYEGFLMPGLLLWGLAGAWRNRKLRALAAGWVLILLWALLREGVVIGAFFDRIPVLGSLQCGAKAYVWIHLVGVALAFQTLAQAELSAAKEKSARLIGILLLGAGAMMIITEPWSLGGKARDLIGLLAVGLGSATLIRRRGKSLVSVRSAIGGAVLLLLSEVVLLAWQYQPRTDPARYRLAPEVDRFAHSLRAETRYAVFEQMESNDPTSLHPLFGLFEVASGAGNLFGSPRIPPARVFLYLNQIFPELVFQTASGRRLFANLQASNPWALDRRRLHLLHLAGVQNILSQTVPVPYSSPYSLLQPFAASWRVVGPAGPLEPKSEGVRIPAPLQVETSLSSLPGDQLHLEYRVGSQDAGGWLGILAARQEPGPGRLLLCRYLRPGEGAEQRIGLEAFLNSAGVLRLAWSPAAAAAGNLRLQRLEVFNPARPFQRRDRWGPVEVFENREALPRPLLVHQTILLKDWSRILERMNDSTRFFPNREVILEQTDPEVETVRRWSALSGRAGPGEGAEIVHYGSQRVEMIAQLSRPGFLVLSDTYAPGWKAYLEKPGQWQEIKIRPANLAFRAVFLLDGKHRIKMIYQPFSFRIGLWFSLASLLGVLGLGLTLVGPGWKPAPSRARGLKTESAHDKGRAETRPGADGL